MRVASRDVDPEIVVRRLQALEQRQILARPHLHRVGIGQTVNHPTHLLDLKQLRVVLHLPPNALSDESPGKHRDNDADERLDTHMRHEPKLNVRMRRENRSHRISENILAEMVCRICPASHVLQLRAHSPLDQALPSEFLGHEIRGRVADGDDSGCLSSVEGVGARGLRENDGRRPRGAAHEREGGRRSCRRRRELLVDPVHHTPDVRGAVVPHGGTCAARLTGVGDVAAAQVDVLRAVRHEYIRPRVHVVHVRPKADRRANGRPATASLGTEIGKQIVDDGRRLALEQAEVREDAAAGGLE